MKALAVVMEGQRVAAEDGNFAVSWWSFTKTVLAAASLVLVARGRLDLDAPVPGRPHLLRHLLQHRAGIVDYGGLAAYHEAVARGDRPWSTADLLARCRADRPLHHPGQGWAYSNIGYLFVAEAIQQASGLDLGDALHDLVLAPLAVSGARLARLPADLVGVTGIAQGYHPGWVYHGLLVGPLNEAALLLDRLLTGDLLPPVLRSAMTAPHPIGGPVPGRPWEEAAYGLGTMCGLVTGGRRVCGHTGGGPASVIAVYRDSGSGCTAAAFAEGGDTGPVEASAMAAASNC